MAIGDSLSPKGNGPFRDFQRKKDLLLTAKSCPALYLILGSETAIPGEDTRGYTFQWPITWQLFVEDTRDPDAALDLLVPAVQIAVEADLQMGGLIDEILYEGDTVFANEITTPCGVIALNYRIEYRRERGNPSANY